VVENPVSIPQGGFKLLEERLTYSLALQGSKTIKGSLHASGIRRRVLAPFSSGLWIEDGLDLNFPQEMAYPRTFR
jgi:hypothetical protein